MNITIYFVLSYLDAFPSNLGVSENSANGSIQTLRKGVTKNAIWNANMMADYCRVLKMAGPRRTNSGKSSTGNSCGKC